MQIYVLRNKQREALQHRHQVEERSKRDCSAVKRRGAATKLVDNHEGPFRGACEHLRGFLRHTFSRYVILRMEVVPIARCKTYFFPFRDYLQRPC